MEGLRGAVPALRAGAVLFAAVTVLMLHAGLRFYTTLVMALMTMCVVSLLVLQDGHGVLPRLLGGVRLRQIGRYSECMYRTHAMVQVITDEKWLPWLHRNTGWTIFLVDCNPAGAADLCGGGVSWRCFQGPFDGWKGKFLYRLPPVGSAARM